MSRKDHPMRLAEDLLLGMGLKHAPIQGFTEGPAIDGRFVTTLDPPGAYYLLGIDNGGYSHNRNDVQVIFWQVPENAEQIAKAIGWDVKALEMLPVVGEQSADAPKIAAIPAAILSPPKAA